MCLFPSVTQIPTYSSLSTTLTKPLFLVIKMLTRLSALVSFGNPEDPRTHVKSLIVADVQMMSSLSAIQSLAELQAKFRPDALMSFDAESVQPTAMRDGSESSGQSPPLYLP